MGGMRTIHVRGSFFFFSLILERGRKKKERERERMIILRGREWRKREKMDPK